MLNLLGMVIFLWLLSNTMLLAWLAYKYRDQL